MDYRNKLGVFTFDDEISSTMAELVACTVMGQYFNSKQGEPTLTDEDSCYNFIRERCGNLLGGIWFDLEIDENVRKYTESQLKAKKVADFDARVQAAFTAEVERRQEEHDSLLDQEDERVRASFGGWLVGPAAVQR